MSRIVSVDTLTKYKENEYCDIQIVYLDFYVHVTVHRNKFLYNKTN